MILRTRFRFFAVLALVLPIVAATSVAAHPPLSGTATLPFRITGVGDRAALVPLAVPYRLWDHPALVVPPPVAPAPGVSQLLPNWEVARNAVELLPNYEPGTVTFELLEASVIPIPAPASDARHVAPIYADKP